MLPRTNRLTASHDIKAAIHRGRRLRTPAVTIYALPRPTARATRIAFIVSKKVHRHAYMRHQGQRLMRAAAKLALPHLKTPFDMVWLATPALFEINNSQELYAKLEPPLASL